jgi:hypothetical protein
LSITAPSRRVPLSAIRDAANSIYGSTVRTPLVRVVSHRQSTTGNQQSTIDNPQ